MKTIGEWFELMPLDIKEKALSYTEDETLNEVRENFEHALKASFIFKRTTEGQDYWYQISKKY